MQMQPASVSLSVHSCISRKQLVHQQEFEAQLFLYRIIRSDTLIVCPAVRVGASAGLHCMA